MTDTDIRGALATITGSTTGPLSRDTLHMWTQIVGKIRLAQAPMVNHWWQVPLYVTPRGLTTSPIPSATGMFEIDFDFCDHRLRITIERRRAPRSRSSPDRGRLLRRDHGRARRRWISRCTIWPVPVEVEPAIPFAQDDRARQLRPRGGAALLAPARADRPGDERVPGAASSARSARCTSSGAPSTWRCTRFSGRTAPRHPGGAPNCADWVMGEAYSHEVSSCGFWPGGGDEGAFYAYAYPEPDGFASSPVEPAAAFYSTTFGEFLLPYEAVRTAPDPDATLLDFLQTTYEAAADPGGWDRAALEADPNRWSHKQ